MSAPALLPVVPAMDSRQRRDRLEILTALLTAPGVEEFFVAELIRFPEDHRVYGWRCSVRGCFGAAVGAGAKDMCREHVIEFRRLNKTAPTLTRHHFLQTALPRGADTVINADPPDCRICPTRPSKLNWIDLCERHYRRWMRARADGAVDLETWCESEQPAEGFGRCRVKVCHQWAFNALGLCLSHFNRYRGAGRPGGVYFASMSRAGDASAPLNYADEQAFRAWCDLETVFYRPGQLSLAGLSPLLQAEFQWGLIARSRRQDNTFWSMHWLQALVNLCRSSGVTTLFDVDLSACSHTCRMIVGEFRRDLRLVYYSPEDSKAAGFIETDHFGVRLGKRLSFYDLGRVPQRWLRDLLWDHLAARLRSPAGARSNTPFDYMRRATVELGAFLSIAAPEAADRPELLTAAHMNAFVADQRRRGRENLPSLGLHRYNTDEPSICNENTCREVFNYARVLLRGALMDGTADAIGLSREFICALPNGGQVQWRARAPFTDEVARALADEENLSRLAERYDPNDRGVRDIWETLVFTGRRANEVICLRLDCVGRYGGLPLLWHDQTKVGNLGEAIRIPERTIETIQRRQQTTVQRFADRYGRNPTKAERKEMALFPSANRNDQLRRPISYGWFGRSFNAWVADLDLGAAVPHQARHTLATRLLRGGATMQHIKQYLGQVSMRMAEHYAKVAVSDIEDVLQMVWVAGPGSATPGRVLASPSADKPLSAEHARAIALDLSRRSTPTEGGFCTFQPVVDGGTCPWKLNCEGCDRFVLSGADLLYWRRKREQWRSLAERAPDDATADWLHKVFEPTAAAIDGLERALAGLGLLEEALSLDLRRPQDYFQRIWSTAFRATDLATLTPDDEERFADLPDSVVVA